MINIIKMILGYEYHPGRSLKILTATNERGKISKTNFVSHLLTSKIRAYLAIGKSRLIRLAVKDLQRSSVSG